MAMHWNIWPLVDVDTVGTRVKQRCTSITQHISLVDVGTIRFVGFSNKGLSYNHPAHVETLGIRSIVGPIAVFSNLVCTWRVSAKQDKDGCRGIESWNLIHNPFEMFIVSGHLRRGDFELVVWEHVTFD